MKVVVDTGNGGPTLFPLSLLEHAEHVRPTKIEISGITPEVIIADKVGQLKFTAPTDPEGTASITVEGAFIDIPEVLISRRDLPEGFDITKGTSAFARTALRLCPDVSLALDHECSATWTLQGGVPEKDQPNGEKHGSSSHRLAQPTLLKLGVQSGDEFLSRACELVHKQLGHPCPRRTLLSLHHYGINISLNEVQSVINACKTCKDKTHNFRPVHNTTEDRDGLVEQDLTQFPFEGINSEKWISVIYDMQHRYIDAMSLKNRSEAPLHTAQYLSKHKHVTRWRVDNAPELNGESMKSCLLKHGVSLESTAPSSSWSNGGAERANQTIKQLITTMMVDLNLEQWPALWPWFVTAACHAHNHTFNDVIKTSPYSSINNNQQSMNSLFPFSLAAFGQGVNFVNSSDGKQRKRNKITKHLSGIFLALSHSGSVEILEPEPSIQGISRHVIHPRTVTRTSEEKTKELLAQLQHIAQLPKDDTAEEKNPRKKPSRVRLIRTNVTFDPEDKLEWACTSHPYNHRTFACGTSSVFRMKTVNLKDCENTQRSLAITDERFARVLRANGHYLTGYGYIANDEAKPADVQAGLFKDADHKEWSCIIENGVLGNRVDDVPAGTRVIRTRLRRIFKADGRAKTRFVVCATHDNRDVPTTTHLPLQYARRVCHLFGLCQGWKAATVDVQTAFLLVPLEEDVYVRLPNLIPDVGLASGHKPSGVYKLKKALYGLKESPRLFQKFLDNKLKSLNFNKLDDGVFGRFQGTHPALVITYVDDILCWSANPEDVLNELRSTLPCAEINNIGSTPTRYVGEDIVAHDLGMVAISMSSFIKDIPSVEEYLEKLPPIYNKKRLAASHLPLIDFHDGFDTLNEQDKQTVISSYRSLVGTLGWVASAHPAMSYRFGELARYTATPGITAFRIAFECLREVAKQEDLFTEISPVERPTIRIWTDANLQSSRSRRGWIIQLVNEDEPLSSKRNILAWKSAKDERAEVSKLSGDTPVEILHHSSVSAETFAIYKAAQETNDVIYSIRSILKPIFPFIPVHLYSDSLSGVEQIKNEKGTKNDRIRNEYIRNWMSGLGMQLSDLRHGPGQHNMADPLTKPKHLDWYNAPNTLY